VNKRNINSVFLIWQKQNPHPTTELRFKNHFELLICVMLSAQATDKSINKITPKLFSIAPTPADFIKIGAEKLKQLIKSIGLYNTKANNIIKTCNILIKEHNSIIPNSFTSLIRLPGVGRKTANVVLNLAFKKPTMGVDTHVFRLANRTAMAIGKTPLEIEKKLLAVIPQEYIINAHHWMILHARYICKSQNPKCKICQINRFCYQYLN
jgi:endonuclease III